MADTNPLAGLTQTQIQAVRALFASEGKKKYDVPLKEPEEFDGDAKKARSFLDDCTLQFNVNPHKFEGPDVDRLKIGYILSNCRKKAARDFADLCFARYEADGKWESYVDFVKNFKAQFITTDEEGTALQALLQLHMKNFANVDAYVSKFRVLAKQAKISENALLKHHFIQGLSSGLKEWLIANGIPTEFNDLVKGVQERYARGELMRTILSRAAPTTRHEERDPNAMDIDAINISPNERDRRRRLGLCFTCGQKGHLTAQCPDRDRRSNAWPRANNNGYPRDNSGRFLPRGNNGFQQNRSFPQQRSNNPFHRQVATTRQDQVQVQRVETLPPQPQGSSGMYIVQEPKEPSVEERAATIAAMLKGSEEENEKIRNLLVGTGF